MSDYHINVFYSDDDEGYIADIPDLVACSAFGETAIEALREVELAKAVWIEAAKDRGKANSSAALSTCYLSGGGVVTQNGTSPMPVLLRIGPYRFFIYSIDCQEPPHAHVERDSNVAKFWLTPVRLQSSGGFRSNEISRIYRVIDDNLDELLRRWYERCDD